MNTQQHIHTTHAVQIHETHGEQESREDAHDADHHNLSALGRRRCFQLLTDDHAPHDQDIGRDHEDLVDMF